MAITNTASMLRAEQAARERAEFRRRFANRETSDQEESAICSQVGEHGWQSLLDLRAKADRLKVQAAIDAAVPDVVAALRAADTVNLQAIGVAIAFGLALLIEQTQAESLAQRERDKHALSV